MRYICFAVLGFRCPYSLRHCARVIASRRKLLFLTALVTALFIFCFRHLSMEPDVAVWKFILTENDLLKMKPMLEESEKRVEDKGFPLLVLFTTFRVIPDREHIYLNTLKTWPLLKPHVKPVLLYSDLETSWQIRAKELGWELLEIQHTFDGLPIFRHMWMDVIRNYKAHYYAYANADILFDESLILTLLSINGSIQNKAPLIIGRRTNYKMSGGENMDSLQAVREVASSSAAELFTKHAQDYFITTSTAFQWKDIPDFVIGRIAYDNWLVSYSIQKNFYVIDTTNTVLCLHQSGIDGNYAGFKHKHLLDINKLLANKNFDYYTLGKTDCAKVVTVFHNEIGPAYNRYITLRVRKPNPCEKIYEKFNLNVNVVNVPFQKTAQK